jgi:hypothetical protein
MSAPNINTLLDLWATTLLKHRDAPLFANASNLYNTIDLTPLGDAPWQSFSLTYNGELPDGPIPPWMTSDYDVWFQNPHIVIKNMIGNPSYINHFNVAPVCKFDSNGDQKYQHFMFGDWAWDKAVHLMFFSSCHANFSL